MNFHVFLPLLKDKVGHIFSYNKAVEKALLLQKIPFHAYIPKNCKLSMEKSWGKTLPATDWEKASFYEKIFAPLKNIQRLKQKIENFKEEDWIFLESFHPGFYLAFMVAILSLPKIPNLLILHRYSPSQKKYLLLYKLYSYFQKQIKKKTTLVLATDTNLLAKEQEKIFDQPVHIFPLPHTFIPKNLHKNSTHLKIYFPGSSLRKEKGVDNFVHFCKTIPLEESAIEIVASQAVQPFINNTRLCFRFLPRELSECDYENELAQADIVLLPYVASLYTSRSSGIFVEAIIAGAIPFTSAKTWMASELNRFDLQELILDWKKPHLFSHVKKIYQNPNISKKISVMKNEYKSFHSIQSYSKILGSIFSEKW